MWLAYESDIVFVIKPLNPMAPLKLDNYRVIRQNIIQSNQGQGNNGEHLSGVHV
jgi:hypothetical protein